ncbi:hypothetical protein CPB86DRAFT_781165 [Serendipita vermifera]|nr:hypothetical protein CPB86DRAFT_781165 [Serendipita vermifera]
MTDSTALPFPHPRHWPTQEEILCHKAAIKELDREIADTENEISTLQTRLHHLQQRRANQASYISPLRCLPPEILIEIVQICLQINVSIGTLTQICGNLRDVVTGTPTFWNRIQLDSPIYDRHFRYIWESDEGWMSCGTVEQLELILTRSGSNPLEILMECPFNPELLGLISSRKCMIKSLKIVDEKGAFQHFRYYDYFKYYDMNALERLSLRCSCEQAAAIMDLALGSTRERIHLELNMHTFTPLLLHHDLIQRAISIELTAGLQLHLDTPKISLPRAEYIDLFGNQNLFEVIDLRTSGALFFKGHGGIFMRDRASITPSYLPSHLKTLSLLQITLCHKPVRPQSFSHLTSLDLQYMTIQGILGEYIEAPRLEYLHLNTVAFESSLETVPQESHRRQLFSDRMFFQGSPGLETISLEEMSIDETFIEGLKMCAQLECLSLAYCSIEDFVPSFLECLGDNRFLPSLATLYFRSLDLTNLNTTPEEFQDQCITKRGGISVESRP